MVLIYKQMPYGYKVWNKETPSNTLEMTDPDWNVLVLFSQTFGFKLELVPGAKKSELRVAGTIVR